MAAENLTMWTDADLQASIDRLQVINRSEYRPQLEARLAELRRRGSDAIAPPPVQSTPSGAPVPESVGDGPEDVIHRSGWEPAPDPSENLPEVAAEAANTPTTPAADIPPAYDPKESADRVVNGLDFNLLSRSDITARQAAEEYRRAFNSPPLPIKRGTKRPAVDDWQNTAIQPEQFDQFWGGPTPCGLGLPLGARTKGLIDLDLDWPEARAISDELDFIYGPYVRYGRASARRSHGLIVCKEALTVDQCRTLPYSVPAAVAQKLNLGDGEHATTILEVRGNGGQSIVPPSIHPSGERIEFEDAIGRSLQTLSYHEVKAGAGLLATLAFFARVYPPIGVRNDFNLAMGGMLLRALISKYGDDEALLIDHVDTMVTLTCRVGGDTGRGSSWERRAAATLAKLKANAPITGLPKMLEILGIPEMSPKIREWLGADGDERPIIKFHTERLVELLDPAENVLLSSNAPVFQASGRLVHVVRFDNPEGNQSDDKGRAEDEFGVRHAIGAQRIEDVPPLMLLEYFCDKIRFWRVTNKGNLYDANPPEKFVKHYLARRGKWRLRVLNGISETPILRADGSLLVTEGYDEASGMLVNFAGVDFPSIPEKPTREQALQAIVKLKAPISKFPFVPDEEDAEFGPNVPSASRSVALSAVLSIVGRLPIKHAPLHAFTAPAPRTGKSMLVDYAAIIATGKVAAAMAQGGDEVEDEKRIGGVLMAGDVLCNIDNVTRPLTGNVLCQVLTQDDVQIRILGKTGQHRFQSRTFWTATGNNLVMLEDVTDRAVLSSLDARMQEPGSRHFDGDFKTDVREQRPQLVAAALTVLRAFIVAGRPISQDPPQMGGFEEWSALVRGALIWLGEPDPYSTRTAIKQDDYKRGNFAALIATIRDGESFGLGVGKAFKSTDLISFRGGHESVRNAIDTIFPPPRGATAKGLTAYLKQHKNRVVSGLALRAVYDKHDEAWQFVLQPVRSGESEGGLL